MISRIRALFRGDAKNLRVMAFLSALMAFPALSTDLFLPAMPTMAKVLGAFPGEMEWAVSSFLIGFSLGQLAWGPIGDRFGRKTPVAAGLLIFTLGSAGCALAANVGHIIVWRIVQALGASAAVVLSRAMIRDLYEGEKAAQVMSALMTIMAVAPLAGPLLGAKIMAAASWRAIFWTLAAFGAATLAALATLPETLPAHRQNKQKPGAVLRTYLELLRQKHILGFAGAGACFYAGLFAYIAGAPFAYIGFYGVSPARFGLLFGSAILAIMAANLLNVRLIPRFGGARLLRFGALGAAASGLALAFAALTGAGGLAGLVAPLIAFNGAVGFIVANSIAGALAAHPERAGAVSALIGALHYGAGIAGSALVGALANGTPKPMGVIIALSGLGSVFCAWTLVTAERDHATEG